MAVPPEIVSASKGFTLAQLNTLVTQQEEGLGPLAAIGNDGNGTLLTFDLNKLPPDTHAVIVAGVAPSGATVVAQGDVFIAGVKTAAVAILP